MPIAGNPKKLAYDVAQGHYQFTPPTLHQHPPGELKAIFFNLNFVLRELRGKQIPLEDIEALKERNVKIQRLNQAIHVIQSYAASKKINL